MSAPTVTPTTDPPVTPAAVLALAPGYSSDAAAGAVSWALGQVEAYCERKFAQRTNTVTVTAAGGMALLPDPPVTDVTLVEGLVRWPVTADLAWQSIDGYQFTEAGEIYDGRACYTGVAVPWPTVSRGLRVTYTHGFENWPDGVISTVLGLAVAYIANPFGQSERRILDTLYRWMPGVGPAGVVDPMAGVADLVLREVS